MRIGIVGLGSAARQMVPSMLAFPQAKITAVADPNEEARKGFCAQIPALSFESAVDLMASDEVDVVYLATPHQLHCEQTVMAAVAGKHIIVEKPMALSLAECDQMIEAAKKAKVHLVVGHTHSFNAPIRDMRKLIEQGAIGPVAMINSWNFGAFLYRPRRPEELRTELGGGAVFNQAPHHIDVARYLAGGLVKSVRATAWVHDDARPTEGSYSCTLHFEGGAVATLIYSGYDFFDTDEFHFGLGELGQPKSISHASSRAALKNAGASASRGRADRPWIDAQSIHPAKGHPHFGVTLVSGPRGDLRQSADGIVLYGPDGMKEIAVEPPKAFPDKTGVLDEMYCALFKGALIAHSGEWGRATMEVCLGLLQSSREGREIEMRQQVALPLP